MRKKIILIILMIIFSGLTVIAQETGPKISVQAGINLFPNPGTGPKVLAEFPFSVNRNDFQFLPFDSTVQRVRAAIYADIIISDTLNNPVDSASTYFYTVAPDSASAKNVKVRLFNKLLLMVAPGVYKGKLNVIDVTSKKSGAMLYDRIIVPAVVSDTLTLSNLELAFQIRVLDDSSKEGNIRLSKNDREVIPNPMGIFSVEDSAIYVYAELYNLSFDSTRKEKFKIHYAINEILNQADLAIAGASPRVEDFGEELLDKPGTSAVLTNLLPLGKKPGKYDLVLSAYDPANGATARAVRRFIVVPRTGYVSPSVTYIRKGPLDTAGAQTVTQVIRFLLSPSESAVFNTLNDTGKVRFAVQFFKDHDPSPGTAANEYLDNALQRYNYAIEKFSTQPGLRDGWKTDRGRVLMQYGNPDQRDEEIAPSEEKPWERW